MEISRSTAVGVRSAIPAAYTSNVLVYLGSTSTPVPQSKVGEEVIQILKTTAMSMRLVKCIQHRLSVCTGKPNDYMIHLNIYNIDYK
jgi:hypothetical protein